VWAAALGTGQALDASAQAWTAIGDAAQVPTPLPQGAMAPGDAPQPRLWTQPSTPGTSRWRPARARR